MSESLILSLESSGNYGSVALSRGRDLLYSATSFLEHGHSALMAPLAEAAMKATEIRPNELNAIAVGAGPGSYTGLRIGVSLAKGMCFALGIPLISVGTMENMAFQAFKKYPDTEKVMALLDARRKEVYAAVFDRSLKILLPVQALVLDEIIENKFFVHESMVLAGDGGRKTMEHFRHPKNWTLSNAIFPNARSLALLAWMKFEKGEFENCANFEPEYIKPVYITGSSQ